MKIVPLASYADAYNRAMDLESEQKTSKKKHKSSNSDDSLSESSSDKESSKKVQALQKDMLRMMKEFKNLKKNPDSMKGELWCTYCKEEGHTKGSCSKKKLRDLPDCGTFHKGMPIQYEVKGTLASVTDAGNIQTQTTMQPQEDIAKITGAEGVVTIITMEAGVGYSMN